MEKNLVYTGKTGVSLLIIFKGGFHISGQVGALLNILAVPADKGAHRLVAADNLQDGKGDGALRHQV